MVEMVRQTEVQFGKSDQRPPGQPSTPTLRIALVQFNAVVGDLEGNAERIVQLTHSACRRHQADLVIFPELSLCGYPLDDLLQRPALRRQVCRALARIQRQTQEACLLVGHPEKTRDGIIYNACSLLMHGERPLTYYKCKLPNYEVFDEPRNFQPGGRICMAEINGFRVAVTICEDLCHKEPALGIRQAGAELILNPSASPYYLGKVLEREQELRQRSRETALPIIHVNMTGAQDDLIFDGASMALDGSGNLRMRAPQFEESTHLVECRRGPGNTVFLAEGAIAPLPASEASVYQALTVGIRDYARKSGFSEALVGLSGGVDSAVTLCLAADALGPENVEALLMPSRHTAPMSIEDAQALAGRLGVKHRLASIEPLYSNFLQALQELCPASGTDVAAENLQARCRGTLLMALSNRGGKLVLATSNKSEAAIGYATLYGDMVGGYAPLKDVYKGFVYALARWYNRDGGHIPERILQRPPSAELRPNQTDQDSLPPYEILDEVLKLHLEQDQSPAQITRQTGFPVDTVRWIVERVRSNEYKRRQSAPGARISAHSFGRDRRYPICSAYRED